MKITYTCKACGSSDVTLDCIGAWDVEAQEWKLIGTLDNADCNECGEETELLQTLLAT